MGHVSWALGVLLKIAASLPAACPTDDPGMDRRDLDSNYNENTHVSLVNATPYRWRKSYNSSYQLTGWDAGWPEYIEPGSASTVYVRTCFRCFPQDTMGEATYRIEGTGSPMSLQVAYRSGKNHRAYVQFLEDLETPYSDKSAQHNLGFSQGRGGVGFVLAGTEGDFISNGDRPVAWMQAQLAEIGHLPLREIAMPRSHHSGQWKSQKPIGVATPRNTQTQSLPLYDQLKGGVRVLDLRPLLRKGDFYNHHGSRLGPNFHGMLGASVKDMVAMHNKFMADHPGELYIWDIHEGDARDGDNKYRPLDDRGRLRLYNELRQLSNRVRVPEDVDLSIRPLNQFISRRRGARGRSSVLVRLPTSWAAKPHFPGSKEGFVSGANFPLKTRWSNTNKAEELVKDQLFGLAEARPSRSSGMYDVQWILTQKGAQVAFPVQYNSIIELSGAAWRTLSQEFWEALTDESYPNWVTMDDIHGTSLKAMAMAINKCFAARRCGHLGGRVTGITNTTLVSQEALKDGTET
ncbi:LysM domain-containing protein [Metarhizium album ARSEF 1941]|uniref:LysM domain-containing protein n=1 Tax=Metarhizium album (strain ARSEF 1941) TaxID=1081103 RepID=A0A0B2X173_METAS|nr:LysM domain-containing protein [Metarhizium album ARSEF 1941]KHN99417.1 LysM domain-containing protein [Metarhizium album ARSEF 1941]